jgi:hypothetical protein
MDTLLDKLLDALIILRDSQDAMIAFKLRSPHSTVTMFKSPQSIDNLIAIRDAMNDAIKKIETIMEESRREKNQSCVNFTEKLL